MGKFKIRVKVEIVESDQQNEIEHGPQEQNDGSFTMIIDQKDAESIDNSEKALLENISFIIREKGERTFFSMRREYNEFVE